MGFILFLAVSVTLAGVWYLRKRSAAADTPPVDGPTQARMRANPGNSKSVRKSAGTRKEAPGKPIRSQWHSMSIECDKNGCSAAKALEGKRFLASEVPTTPLLGCDASVCNCRYRHHEDRRTPESDRRNPSSLCSQLHDVSDQPDRRGRRGRRATDHE